MDWKMTQAILQLTVDQTILNRIKDVGVLEVEIAECHVKIGRKKKTYQVTGMGKKYGKKETIQLVSLKEIKNERRK